LNDLKYLHTIHSFLLLYYLINMSSPASSDEDVYDDEDMLSLLLLSDDSELFQRQWQQSQFWTVDLAADKTPPKHWTALVQTAQRLGFDDAQLQHLINFSMADPKQQQQLTTNASAKNNELPAAFTTETGQLHTTCLQALLQLDTPAQAVPLTLGAMRTTSASIGSLALVEHVVAYAARQKLARMDIVAEFLRRNDDKSFQKADGKSLFAYFLQSTCQPDVDYTWEQLHPVKALLGEQRQDWDSFVRRLQSMKDAFVFEERLHAMEALVALLYTMPASRTDYLLLLLAVQSTEPLLTHHARFSRLAGLLCVEALALWRVIVMDETNSWLLEHPFWVDLADDPDTVMVELKAITTLQSQCLEQVQARKPSNQGLVEQPETLASLALGLLLKITAHSHEYAGADSYWTSLGENGMTIVQSANDLDVLDYMYTVMASMVPALSVASNNADDLPDELATEHDAAPAQPELSAPCLAYASIGRELLSAVALALEDTMLSINHASAPEQIGILTNLAMVIHRNSPTMCESFWEDWDIYTSPREKVRQPVPLCKVLDSAYSLAATCLQEKKNDAYMLRGISPLLQMTAAVAANEDHVEKVLATCMPPGLILTAISICASTAVSTDARQSILEALAIFASIGKSEECRKIGESLKSLG
jgi:hypothetical protein